MFCKCFVPCAILLEMLRNIQINFLDVVKTKQAKYLGKCVAFLHVATTSLANRPKQIKS